MMQVKGIGWTEQVPDTLICCRAFFLDNRYITAHTMSTLLGLTPYMAQKWLGLFCQKGIMVKNGTRHAPIYFLK